jgi:hypothetical protein
MNKTLFRISASLLLIFILLSFPVFVGNRNASAQTTKVAEGKVVVTVSIRGTYLHADEWRDINDDGSPDPSGGGPVEPAAIVDLQAYGFMPGDNILISYTGQMNGGENSQGLWQPNQDITYKPISDNYYPPLAVFSATNVLLDIDQTYRVPGAIDAGSDKHTGETWFDKEPTDIPEDFVISPSTGLRITIPSNAKYLFLSEGDNGYIPDNAGSLQVTIEKQTVVTSTGGFPLEYLFAALGIVAVVAVLLVFVVFRRRKQKTGTQKASAT